MTKNEFFFPYNSNKVTTVQIMDINLLFATNGKQLNPLGFD